MRRNFAVMSVLLACFAAGAGCQQWNKMWGKDNDSAKMERISMSALPEPVRASFNSEFPNAKVDSIARETEKDGEIHYEFKFSDQSGRKQEVEYDGKGKRAHEEK